MICIYIYTYLCGAPHQYRIVLEVHSSLIQNSNNMRKNVLKTVLLALLAVVGLASCGGSSSSSSNGQNNAEYDALRPTLLGGVYFYRGYGGVQAVDSHIKSGGVEQIEGYKQLFINPYEEETASNANGMLRKDWSITNADELKAQLEKLKTQESEHKAWDFARAVNISWAGLRVGYLTQAEVEAYQKELLALAQAKYPDWTAYFNDFLAGRTAWDPNDEYGGKAELESVVKDILESPASIYKVIPLK